MGAQADQVRDDIIRRVMARQLMPGDKVDESELRARLALSGTPVREAILTLEARGIVERRPRGGARIIALDLEGLIKLIEALSEAEGSVAYRAARRINKAQVVKLEQAVVQCELNAQASVPGADYYDLNLDFHHALIDAAGNEYLEEAVLRFGNRLIGYLSARHQLPGEKLRSAADHRKIYQAVVDANGDLARDLMISHVTMTDTMALDVMNAMREK
ncbi:MAG: GntR family transcriptional regulator [Rhodobacteraceae bacterium]|nr:GntR family transcriptional regulator [Paracoccaceae bacterium]